MSILRIIFALLKNLDGDLSVPDITSLQNIFSILSDGNITQSSINALRKAVSSFSDRQLKKAFKMKFNIADMSPAELCRNMRAIQTEKQAHEVIKNDIKRQLKELEQAQALALQKTVQQDREVLNRLKQVFTVLESNLYERLAVYTPVDTGNLLSSVYAKHVGSLAIQIGFNTVQAPYAIYVHEILGNKHPNGGIPQFLLTAFLEAWTQTMGSASEMWLKNSLSNEIDAATKKEMAAFFFNTLKTMNYGIDISKNKLAVTISLASDAPLTNLNSTVLDILDATEAHPTETKGKAEALFKDYKETLFNYLNDTNLSYEQITSLSTKGRKKLNLLTLNREYSQDHKSNKTWRQRQQRLKNVANKLHKFNIEEKNDILKIKTSAADREINTTLFNSDTSSALAVRLDAEGKFIKTKIIYPLILDKVDRQYKKQDRLERQAELDAEDEELQELYWSQHASYDDVLEMEASRAEQQAEYEDDEEFDDDELLEEFEEQEVDANTANIYEMLRGGMKTLEPDKPANPFDDMDNDTLFDMLENADEYGIDDNMYSALEALADSRFGG